MVETLWKTSQILQDNEFTVEVCLQDVIRGTDIKTDILCELEGSACSLNLEVHLLL